MKNTLTIVSFVLVAFVSGCNTSPDGPLGTDAGIVPMGDSGPVVVGDSAVGFRPPVCSGIDDHVSRLRVRVVNPAPLGTCAGTWSAFALLDGRTVGTLGSTFDQSIPDADMDGEYDWNGYMQLGFQCSSDARWFDSAVDGTTASAMGVEVTVWYGTREVDMSHTRVSGRRLTIGMHESCGVL